MKPINGLARTVRRPWVWRTLLILVTLLVLFGLFGSLVLPGIIKSQAEKAVSAALHRSFTIERVQVRPFSLALAVHGIVLHEPDGKAVFASVQDLRVRVSAASLFRLAPVVRQVQVVGPTVHLVRTAANHYSTDDIVAALAASRPEAAPQPAKPAAPARFSVYNIQVEGGRFDFDDRPTGAHHSVTDLKLGIPFISSLPSQEEVFVEPLLSAVVNGSPLSIKGKARPFAENREAVVDLDLDRIDIPKYLEYLPFEPRFHMPTAQLELHLHASFQQPPERAPALVLSGTAALKSLKLTTLADEPILALPELRVELGQCDPIAGGIEIARVTASKMELNVLKDARGELNLSLLGPPPDAQAQTARAPAGEGGAATPARPAMRLHVGEVALQDAAFRYSDRNPAQPLEASVEQFDLRIGDSTLELQDQRLGVGRIESVSARFRVQQGRSSAAPVPAKAALPAAASHPGGRPASPDTAAAWTFSVGKVSIGNWALRIESRGLPQVAVTAINAITLEAENLSNARDSAPGRIELKAQVNRGGSVSVAGAVGLAPIHADLALDLKQVDLLPAQPYVTERVNLLVTRAELGVRGRLLLDQGSGGGLKGGFRGDLALGNLATIDKVNANDFLNWKALTFGGVNLKLAPLALDIDRIALNDFFARVIIDPSGRINLQDILSNRPEERRSLTSEQPENPAPPASQPAPAEAAPAAAEATPAPAEAAPAPAEAAPAPAAQTAAAPASAAAGPAAAAPVPIRIGQIALQSGQVRFTDNFIKPNYTANLVDLGGTVGGLSSTADSTAAVDLHGQVNNAPLNIAGQINPLKGDLFLDIKAGVHGMELAPLSPYSGKYVGYGIERGKLSFDVAYKLEHRKLSAENRLVLDQLTFGDKVESPSAIKLPVLLAVALLKDRNGVIDINLPIGGSLDDPRFSVGGVIVKVLLNLITKAVTAPFALLGNLFGGGQELSYVDYAPGHAEVSAAAESRLKSLATALKDRPGLKLEIAARVDPDRDRDGLKRESLDRRVRTLKVKDLVAKGESATMADVTVSPEEYPALLQRIYQAERQGKPAGASDSKQPPARASDSKQPPPAPADMEQQLLAATQVTDDELMALGDRRSQAVKLWLQTRGEVAEDRLFLLATKLGRAGAEQKAGAASGASRVEFSLK